MNNCKAFLFLKEFFTVRVCTHARAYMHMQMSAHATHMCGQRITCGSSRSELRSSGLLVSALT